MLVKCEDHMLWRLLHIAAPKYIANIHIHYTNIFREYSAHTFSVLKNFQIRVKYGGVKRKAYGI